MFLSALVKFLYAEFFASISDSAQIYVDLFNNSCKKFTHGFYIVSFTGYATKIIQLISDSEIRNYMERFKEC